MESAVSCIIFLVVGLEPSHTSGAFRELLHVHRIEFSVSSHVHMYGYSAHACLCIVLSPSVCACDGISPLELRNPPWLFLGWLAGSVVRLLEGWGHPLRD